MFYDVCGNMVLAGCKQHSEPVQLMGVAGTASASIKAHLMLCALKVPSYAHFLVHTFILGVSEIMFTRFTVQRRHYFFLILSIAAAPFFFSPLSECTVLAPVAFRADWVCLPS